MLPLRDELLLAPAMPHSSRVRLNDEVIYSVDWNSYWLLLTRFPIPAASGYEVVYSVLYSVRLYIVYHIVCFNSYGL